MEDNTLIARRDDSGNLQTLFEHLHNAGLLAQSFEEQYGHIAYMAGLLHDAGKATDAFQKYIRSADGVRASIAHAKQGGFLISDVHIHKSDPDKRCAQLTKEILELVISRHHGNLPDCVYDEKISNFCSFFDEFGSQSKNDKEFAYDEVCRQVKSLDLEIEKNFEASVSDVQKFYEKLTDTSPDSKNFYIGLFVKYIYSRLIDADRLDARNFAEQNEYVTPGACWEVYAQRFEENLKKFADSSNHSISPINEVRQRVNDECKRASNRETGIYKLAVPTGGGKTLASLNFAINHARAEGKRRIIYVVPYLSITTQTAQVFRDILGLGADDENGILFEHYSSPRDDTYDEESENADKRLMSERWDSPIVVTTMVQFLETIMSSRGTNLRKFHNMADSVIIFDEIQALPTNSINLFNEFVSFLSKILGSTIVLCSATQPMLERTGRKNLLLAENPDLVKLSESDWNLFKRTRIVGSIEEKTTDELAQFVYEEACKNDGCLVIVNLKSEAREVYRRLAQLNADGYFTLIHLSTAMCGKHRSDFLEKIQRSMNESKPVICVSTQLVEAGVDLSFPCVVRAMAGLDSIVQAAGRCNRNGESEELKNVYVFPIKNEPGLKNLPDVKIGKKITAQLIREFPDADLLSSRFVERYYSRFLERIGHRGGYMDYPIEDGHNVYSLLAYNKSARRQYRERSGKTYPFSCAQSFKTADENFHVIPHLHRSVVVRYGDAENILGELKTQKFPEKYALLRRLQDFSVNLCDDEFEKMLQNKAITAADEDLDVYALDGKYYNEEWGCGGYNFMI